MKKIIIKIYLFVFSQSVEDLKQIINELNEKFHNRQTMIDQLNNEIEQLKKQSQVCYSFQVKILFIFIIISR
jgi:uncharacterized coiled-coil DUF342 family protein